ncbi:MAG: GAF domain-containing SpoIIE family protein phosphatase [Chitinophagales bacterium]
MVAIALIFGLVPLIISEVTLSVLFILTLSLLLAGHSLYSFNKSVFKLEELFTKVIIAGATSFVFAFFPTVLQYAMFDDVISSRVSDHIALFAIINYFLFALFMFRKLVYHRKNSTIIRQWQTYVTILAISICLQVTFIHLPNFIYFTVLLAGLLSMMSLLWRITWIALLKDREKWLFLVFLVVISLISFALLQRSFRVDSTYLLLEPLVYNVFFILTITTPIAYGLLSILAILFSMPISSVIQDQKTEISSFQEISLALQNRESKKQIFKRLFAICKKNTQSDAGWLLLKSDNKEDTYHTEQVSNTEIDLLNIKINLRYLISVEPSEGYYYFNNLDELQDLDAPSMSFKSLIIFPIFAKNNQLDGMICLVKSFVDGFDDYMISLVKGYVNQAKLAFENALLVEETIKTARYKEELGIARKVQQALFPKEFPATQYCEIAAFNSPAKEVGGDYYDYNKVDELRLALVIGDVSGKGTSAAFHMAQMKGIFQSLMQLCLPADSFLMMANQAVGNCLERSRFISLVYILLDFGFDTLSYSRAGHCPMLFYSAKTEQVTYFSGKGLGLGIIRNSSYAKHIDIQEIKIQKNDVIVLYTDGLVEGRKNDSADEQYGYERLKYCLRANCRKSAEEIKQAICDDFYTFSENSTYKDDTTLLVIKITKQNKVGFVENEDLEELDWNNI